MKSPIITVSLVVLASVSSYYLGANNALNEQVATLNYARFSHDLQNAAAYHATIQKLDKAQYQQSIEQLDGWLSAELDQMTVYRDSLQERDQARVDMLLSNVAEYRATRLQQSALANKQLSTLEGQQFSVTE